MDILKELDFYELSQVCDAVKQTEVKAGEQLIQEGEDGNEFFILLEGRMEALKRIDGEPKKVLEYKKGDYFGELALIRNKPRAASIVARSDCKLLSLDRHTFKRLLGPLNAILKRNSETYTKYIKK